MGWVLKQDGEINCITRIQLLGRHHLGLDGARNTAKLIWRMMQGGCVMEVTKGLGCVMEVTKGLDEVGTEIGLED